MINSGRFMSYLSVFMRKPQAVAQVFGNKDFPQLKGNVCFYQTKSGVIIAAEIDGLPASDNPCQSPFLGFHIHEGSACQGDEKDSFSQTMGHFNPQNCPHPFHSGDLPPLLSNNGYAFHIFLSDRFTVNEILGKTVIIHSSPDDFKSQPSGNAGKKIACGIITRNF